MSAIEAMDLSPAQKPAVLDPHPRVLVAAGAGSGKTRLLVAYFVRALVDEGIPVEQLVAVTFTRKAAAELATRIRSSLEMCGRSDLARSLDAATIGTIHSLCRRLVKERALEAGVDPACAVLEAEAAALIKDEVSRWAWERVVERAGESELEVLASRGESLRKEIAPLYDRLRGMGREVPQIAAPSGTSEESARPELARLVREALAEGRALDRRTPTLEADLGRLEACRAWLESPQSLADGETALEATVEFFPSRKTRSMEPCFEPVRDALTRYRCALAEARLRPVVSTMNSLLMEFHLEYEARKRELGLVDFADLELRARALVTGDLFGGADGAGIDTAASKDGANRTAVPALPGSWVLVDEFQDTNELQCSIIEGLGAARLLMVGDERQSIYRFRGADVGVFRRREAELSSPGPDAPAGGVHRLDVNYRSSPEILAFVNRLFCHSSFFGTRFAPLRSPDLDEDTLPTGTAAVSPSVEVLVVDRRQGDDPEAPPSVMQEAEAEAVAARVRRLLDDEGRRQRDIVVLLPAHTHVDLYQQALLARGVEAYVVGGKGYYSQEEVADVTSLLRLLVNPHDDLVLVSVLRSPLAGISDDGLYLLGREGRRERLSLWEVVREARADVLGAEDRRLLSVFVERFAEIRRRVGRPGLARLIDDAVSICDYDVCLLASPDGKRRFANVRKLMRMAGEFEALEGPDVAAFVDLLQSMGDLSDREGSAPTLAEGEDVVRVMTIHQAKGLEFPVVVLAGLGSDVPRGAAPEFVVGDDGRMGVFLRGSQRKTYESHDLCWGPAGEIVAQERAREQEEDIRLLYVAMTRAEKRLVLVGARPKDDKLESCRVGRIVIGLGLDAMPSEGASVPVDGLDAVVAGVTFSQADATSLLSMLPAPGAVSEEEVGGRPPHFLATVPRGIVPRNVSYSGLAAYQRCPRQFYLERVLGLGVLSERAVGDAGRPAGQLEGEGELVPGDDESLTPDKFLLDEDEQHEGRDVGLLVHALLERLPIDSGPPTEDMLQTGAQEWLLQTGSRLSRADQDRARDLTLAFWESPFVNTRSNPLSEREAPFMFAQGDTTILGIMDLVCRGEELWQIIDYKTNALKGRSPVEVASGYEMQADVYCLAALRAGAPAARMDFVFLERPEEPVTVKHGREDIPQLESALERALDGLRRGDFPRGADGMCGRCSIAEVCAGMAWPGADGIQ